MAAAESAPAPEVLALAPEPIVETVSPKSAGAEAPIRPSPELPVAQVSAIPAPTVPGQAAPAELPRAETPRVETAKTEIITGPPATVVAEDKAPSSLAASVPASAAAAPQDVKLLLDQGKQFFDVGDLIAARILFLRAANAGDAAAAVAMGATYDPVVLADRGVRGVAADLDKARKWYERAREMGSPEGPRRLEMLANR
jgi:TPR repeat protein